MLDDGGRAAGLARCWTHVLSVEAVGVFKPDPRVYRLAGTRFGLRWQRDGVRVLQRLGRASARCGFGFRVFWCNRAGQPDEYGLRRASPTDDCRAWHGACRDLLA